MQGLKHKLEQNSATIGVIGMGYVGLPLALSFCEENFSVLGFDVDEKKVEQIRSGRSYIHHIASDKIKELVDKTLLEATSDFGRIAQVDILIICVPTPLGKHQEPNLEYVKSTGRSIAKYLRVGQMVILESTTYPGTTTDVLKPILEESGLKAGKDFYLGFSPEREDPGNPVYTTRKIPKVVGADDAASRELASSLYLKIVPSTVVVSNTKTAEAVKITENIFRCVNIALVNELKTIYHRMGINVWEVIDAAKSKPFGFMPFYPGPGLGGHCIPIDPFYLTWKAQEYGVPTRFIELAGEINTQMPTYVVHRLMEELNEQGKTLNGARILLVGVAYKKDVDDTRESPAYPLMELLHTAKAETDFYDPFVPTLPYNRHYPHLAQKKKSIEWKSELISQYDVALIVTDHSDIDYQELVTSSQFVLDTRNATKNVKENRNKIALA